jgi:hypothetical protein
MNKHPIFLLLLVGYIFFPAALDWVTNPKGSWYNPFIVWIFVIIGAFLLQNRHSNHDS